MLKNMVTGATHPWMNRSRDTRWFLDKDHLPEMGSRLIFKITILYKQKWCYKYPNYLWQKKKYCPLMIVPVFQSYTEVLRSINLNNLHFFFHTFRIIVSCPHCTGLPLPDIAPYSLPSPTSRYILCNFVLWLRLILNSILITSQTTPYNLELQQKFKDPASPLDAVHPMYSCSGLGIESSASSRLLVCLAH